MTKTTTMPTPTAAGNTGTAVGGRHPFRHPGAAPSSSVNFEPTPRSRYLPKTMFR